MFWRRMRRQNTIFNLMGRDQDLGPGRDLVAEEEEEEVAVAPALVAVAPALVVGVPPVVHLVDLRLVVLPVEVLVVVAGMGRWWLWGRTLP